MQPFKFVRSKLFSNRQGGEIMKKIMFGLLIVMLMLSIPNVALAGPDAQGAQHEMRNWNFGTAGDSAGISIGYIGADGQLLLSELPLSKDEVSGHENDPTWTGTDSAAPFLAYIKKNGIDNNIKNTFDVTNFDPVIIQALKGQGVSLSQFGVSNPQVGPSVFPSTLIKLVVGIGVSSSSSSTTQPTPIPTSSSSSANNTSSNSTGQKTSPQQPVSVPKAPTTPTETTKTQSSDIKVGTNLNLVPETQAPTKSLTPDPTRVNPPTLALQDTTPSKIPDPTKEEQKSSLLWPILGFIAAILLIGGIIFGIKYKYKISGR